MARAVCSGGCAAAEGIPGGREREDAAAPGDWGGAADDVSDADALNRTCWDHTYRAGSRREIWNTAI